MIWTTDRCFDSRADYIQVWLLLVASRTRSRQTSVKLSLHPFQTVQTVEGFPVAADLTFWYICYIWYVLAIKTLVCLNIILPVSYMHTRGQPFIFFLFYLKTVFWFWKNIKIFVCLYFFIRKTEHKSEYHISKQKWKNKLSRN